MAVPNDIRDSGKPAGVKSTSVWIVSQLFGSVFLYQLVVGDMGNTMLHAMGTSPQMHETMAKHVHLTGVGLRQVIFGMFAFRTVSMILWSLFLQSYDMSVPFAIQVTGFNIVLDTMVGLVAIWNRDNFMETRDWWIISGFVFGVLLERIPEIQRRIWKTNPQNRGKMHTGGLFSILVHANYTGYLMWRMCLFAMTQFLPLQLLTAMLTYHFITEDIKVQKERNLKKYGEEFKRYWDKTAKLIPFVY